MQSQNMPIEPGAVVLARDGYLGTVEEVIPANDTTYFVTAPNTNGERLLVPVSLVDPNSRPDEILLREVFQGVLEQSRTVPAGVDPRTLLPQVSGQTYNQPPSGQPLNTAGVNDGRLVVPVVEEQLKVDKRMVELGAVELRKTVEEFQDVRNLPLTFDQLDVERVPVNRPLTAPLEPRYEGDVLIIPVMEEVLVVEKRLMLVEEVRIHKRQVVRDQQINETLRREHIEVVAPDNDLVTVKENTGTAATPAATSAANPATPGPVPFIDDDQATRPVPIVPPSQVSPYQPIGLDQPPPGPVLNPNRANSGEL